MSPNESFRETRSVSIDRKIKIILFENIYKKKNIEFQIFDTS